MSSEKNWETRRQKLMRMLSDGEVIYMKAILTELEYNSKRHLIEDINSISNSLKNQNLILEIDPAVCLVCNFVFNKKDILIKIPSKCPKCKKQRIEWPSIRIIK